MLFIAFSGVCLSHGFSQEIRKDSMKSDKHSRKKDYSKSGIRMEKLYVESKEAITDSLRKQLDKEHEKNLQIQGSYKSSENSLRETEKRFDKYKKDVLIAGGSLAFALLSFGMFMGNKKRQRNTNARQVSNQLKNKDRIIEAERVEKEQTIEEYKRRLDLIQDENNQLKLSSANSKLPQTSSSNFWGQVLLSAGPRKTSRDSELGEDTAGFCVDGNRAFFWVLDGTSDSPVIAHGRKEIMSSRLLAQHLGVNLQKGIADNNSDSKSWLENAIRTTEEQWKQTFSNISEEERKDIIEDLVKRADMADVSTTAIVGIVGIDGKASIARIGDSKVFCLDKGGKIIEDKLAQKPQSESYGRLYARVTRTDVSIDLSLTKSMDILRLHDSDIDEVKTVLAFSDGIGPITENFLREHFDKRSLEDTLLNIVGIPQQTYDDKSLVIIQIR